MSDSRLTRISESGPKVVTDRFTKLFIIPYNITSWNKERTKDLTFKGEVGFAFAGYTLLATALQAMAGNLLTNLHDSEGKAEPPTFRNICECILRAAQLLHQDTLLNPLPYEAFIFGFCPSTKAPHIFHLGLETGSIPYEVIISERKMTNGITYFAGSGSKYFHEVIKPKKERDITFEEMFLKTVECNPDKGTGGPIQILSVRGSEAVIEGVLQADTTRDNSEIYLSGVSETELGKIGGYGLGRVCRGVGIPTLIQRGALRRLGYDPDDPKLPRETKNYASMNSMLITMNNLKSVSECKETISLPKVEPENGRYYFSKVCTSCFRLTPLLHDPSNGENPRPFVGNGHLKSPCFFCETQVLIPVIECVSRKW